MSKPASCKKMDEKLLRKRKSMRIWKRDNKANHIRGCERVEFQANVEEEL